MQTDQLFRICSMTKPITSVAVMMLYEEGRFLLNDPVANFIPEFKEMKVLAAVCRGPDLAAGVWRKVRALAPLIGCSRAIRS